MKEKIKTHTERIARKVNEREESEERIFRSRVILWSIKRFASATRANG